MARGVNRPKHFLRVWRKFRGYTLEQAAEHVGMSHQNLGKIERGRVPYSEPLLDMLADFYRTDRGSLITRDPNRADSLWSTYDQLAPPERERLAKMVVAEFKKMSASR